MPHCLHLPLTLPRTLTLTLTHTTGGDAQWLFWAHNRWSHGLIRRPVSGSGVVQTHTHARARIEGGGMHTVGFYLV